MVSPCTISPWTAQLTRRITADEYLLGSDEGHDVQERPRSRSSIVATPDGYESGENLTYAKTRKASLVERVKGLPGKIRRGSLEIFGKKGAKENRGKKDGKVAKKTDGKAEKKKKWNFKKKKEKEKLRADSGYAPMVEQLERSPLRRSKSCADLRQRYQDGEPPESIQRAVVEVEVEKGVEDFFPATSGPVDLGDEIDSAVGGSGDEMSEVEFEDADEFGEIRPEDQWASETRLPNASSIWHGEDSSSPSGLSTPSTVSGSDSGDDLAPLERCGQRRGALACAPAASTCAQPEGSNDVQQWEIEHIEFADEPKGRPTLAINTNVPVDQTEMPVWWKVFQNAKPPEGEDGTPQEHRGDGFCDLVSRHLMSKVTAELADALQRQIDAGCFEDEVRQHRFDLAWGNRDPFGIEEFGEIISEKFRMLSQCRQNASPRDLDEDEDEDIEARRGRQDLGAIRVAELRETSHGTYPGGVNAREQTNFLDIEQVSPHDCAGFLPC